MVRQDNVDLSPEDIPKKWYNIIPDLPVPIPPYKDYTHETDLRQLPELFTKTASKMEFSKETRAGCIREASPPAIFAGPRHKS